jgi:hypothetical protein
MRKLIMSVLAFVFLSLGCTVANAAPAPKKQHALVKVSKAVVKVAAVAPKATAVALKDTIGAVLFAAEAGVDVAHAGTTALSKAGSMELKVNPFVYVDKVVGYVDTGLEVGYSYFFNLSI